MEETAKDDLVKKSSNEPGFFGKIGGWWKGIKSEFKKIVWPSKNTLIKESTAVVIISVILGALIYGLDFVIRLGFSAIIK